MITAPDDLVEEIDVDPPECASTGSGLYSLTGTDGAGGIVESVLHAKLEEAETALECDEGAEESARG